MKISLFQFVLIGILAGVGYAHPSEAQELLQERVTLSIRNGTVKEILQSIEKQMDVVFSYQREVLPANEKITVKFNQVSLETVLASLLIPRHIRYEVFRNKQIILSKNNMPDHSQVPPQTDKLADSPAFPDDIAVSGKVIDENGSGLPGVSILVKGTQLGTTTDQNGSYLLDVPNPDAILVFSFVGYISQETVVGNQTTIDISLKPDLKALEEVVVVGYGTQKKSDLTGSVVRANIEAFRESPNVNLAQSLQGTVPGLNIGQVTQAGQNPSISIRGRTTINGNQNVLLVVDGIIFTGNMSDLNPADIESVDVLKDPSSMAIYGAQAANGVILITTKGGQKATKPIFNYTGSYTTQTPSNTLHLLDRDGFIKKAGDVDWQKAFLAPDYTQPNPAFSYADVANDPPLRAGFENGTNYNWWDNTTNPGFIASHNLSVRGSGQEFSYFLSGGYTNQKGFVMNDKFKRITTRINIENKIFKWFRIGAQTFGSFSDYSGVSPALNGITIMSPLVQPTDAEGNYILNPNGTNNANPFLVAAADDFDKRNNLFGNFYANIDVPFVKGLSYRINYGHNYSWDRNYNSNPYANGAAGGAFKTNVHSYDWTLDNIVNYKKSFKEIHNVDVTLVAGRRERKYENTTATGTNYSNLRLIYNNLSLGTIQNIGSEAWDESYLYQTGRINYEFKYRYLLTATLRRDGFSGFAENKKTALFPSLGFGWVLSEENFMKVPAITMLKLRGSYGTNGNLVSRYASLARLNAYPAYVFGEGGSTEFGQLVTTLANPNLSWETTTGFNFGLDFSLLKNRLSGSVDYYRTTTNDLIFNVNIPEVTGFNQITSNVGNIANRGIELILNGKVADAGDFKWNATFNLASNRNRIVSLLGLDNDGDGVEDDLVASGLFIGQPIGAIYDYESAGIIQIGEEAPTGYFVGTHRIVDQNGDGFIDAQDRVIRGQNEPAYNFGLLNEFSYRNFTLRFFINSIQGGKNGYRALNMPSSLGIGDNIRRNNFWRELDYWTPANPDARYRGLDQGAATEYNYYDNRSFVRLQDVTLSYGLGQSVAGKLGLQGLKVFVSGKNLATLTKWVGWDPETGSGLATNGLPVMKGISVGLDVRF
ncbi:SusC/RagA family TonB-linked outer membrane protein [Salmonirosea aquatica]